MMSIQAMPLEMHERLHRVENPFYGERDYSFSFEFCATDPVWLTHAVDYVSSNVASPNIWMGESSQDHYVTRNVSDVVDERVFSERECRSFTLFCREGQLHLVLTVWGEDAEGEKLSRSRYDKRFTTIATRQVEGRGDFLRLAHDQPCVIKLQTQDGLSRIKVWNTRETGQEPFVLDIPDEAFRGFFAGFSAFQFNALPAQVKTGKHSLTLQQVAAWRGNAAPEGERNFRDCLEQQKGALQDFGLRQLPLANLTAHYPLRSGPWNLLEDGAFFVLKNAGLQWRGNRGLCFQLGRNQCSISLRASSGRGASTSFMLDVLPRAAGLAGITSLGAQVDEWARAEAGFASRNQRLKFRKILAAVEAFDASGPLGSLPDDNAATVAAIGQGKPPAGLEHFMAQLKVSGFSERSTLPRTLAQLQAALNKDKALNDEQREDMGVLTLTTSAPESSIVFRLQILRSMVKDPGTGALRYAESVVVQDGQGKDQGTFDLVQNPGLLLLCLSDDRQAVDLFFATAGLGLGASLAASWRYSLVDAPGTVKGQVIDEVVLELGRDEGVDGRTRVAIRHLSQWNRSLWKREGLVTAGEQPDQDYNVKTLVQLHFSGLFEPLVEQYLRSVGPLVQAQPA